ncbi:MAG: asparaginase [Pseudomonadota bacterium]|nr:asparaginase [Pseudomonadota bacterium]
MAANKIKIIYTGGTIGMVRNADGSLSLLQEPDDLLASLPELHQLADIEFEVISNIDSSDMTAAHWLRLAAHIRNADAQGDSNGYVILHGTDTLPYTASALSFLLAGLRKPVVITGSQIPLCAVRTDARTNLIDAVELATHDIPEVSVLFNSKLMRGNRVQKVSINRYHAMHSPNYPYLAELGLRVEVRRDNILRKVKSFPATGFSSAVACLQLFPGFDLELLRAYDACQAIILRGFGPGNVPQDQRLFAWIEGMIARGSVVALTSQATLGSIDLSIYGGSRRALALGVLSCHDMTIETCIVKMMLLLGSCATKAEAEELFCSSLVGELTTEI